MDRKRGNTQQVALGRGAARTQATRAPVLLSGFEPFAGDARNPSQEAVAALAGARIGGRAVRGICLPVRFGAAAELLLAEIRRWRPALVIATGLAAGRAELSIERFALNHIDARIADATGNQPRDAAVMPGRPLALAGTLPVEALLQRLQAAGIPAAPSLSAGAYVCNELYYRLCQATRGRRPVGFIHLPYASEQLAGRSGIPSLPLATIIEGLRLAVLATLVWCSGHTLPKSRSGFGSETRREEES